ncbi:MAG: cytochrome ubiquinol oxidase subunit I, partial [Novosphingobium sp.]
LEWLPTELFSTRSIPVVKSREPLWDNPDLSDDVEQGRYFLPNSATGRRETIVTSPLLAEPQYLQIMPGPSPWPFAAAIFTAGFFLALTVQAYMFAWVSGALATVAVLRWLWDTDRPVDQPHVDIGAGIRVPTYVTGPSSHGWWAMVILMIVMGMIFAMALFSLAFLWGNQPSFWTKPLPLTEGMGIVAGYAGVMLAAWATRRLHLGGKSWASIPVLLGALATLGLTWLDASAWFALLPPDTSGQSAAVNAILCLQAMVGAIAMLMAAYLGWRAVKGLISATRNNTLDLTCLFVGYAGAQGLVGTIFTRAIGA